MTANLVLSSPFPSSSPSIRSYTSSTHWNQRSAPHSLLSPITNPSHPQPPRFSRRLRASPTSAMEAKHSQTTDISTATAPPMKLLFVEMGVGYDQHGQDITAAAMRACRDAISSNSIPAFRRELLLFLLAVEEDKTSRSCEISKALLETGSSSNRSSKHFQKLPLDMGSQKQLLKSSAKQAL
ncbi:hypothetical protein TIFTF001_012781 [Ficus carica]|uniref:Uncharacterized protein n=1 Tax=Ficus carica TaxID=3494 RepID=A0AA88A0X1_FICCA|nr:hypothetical protein TIFTF001_012781 [Ficus carica]